VVISTHLPPPVITERTALLAATTHILCCSCGMYSVRIVDMSGSNSWAEFASLFRSSRQAFLDHERSKVELKALMPDDAKEAVGHGVRAKRSKSGAVSFDLLEVERGHAAVQ